MHILPIFTSVITPLLYIGKLLLLSSSNILLPLHSKSLEKREPKKRTKVSATRLSYLLLFTLLIIFILLPFTYICKYFFQILRVSNYDSISHQHKVHHTYDCYLPTKLQEKI